MQTIVSQNSATPHVEVDLTFRRTITIASSGRKRGGMGKVVGFVGAKCGTCGVWCQGSPTCLLQKNLESRKDESKTVNWNFLQLRTGGVTYETSEVVRKKTKHTVIKRVEFDPSSVWDSWHLLRSGTRETVTLMFLLVYPREYGGGVAGRTIQCNSSWISTEISINSFFCIPFLPFCPLYLPYSTVFHLASSFSVKKNCPKGVGKMPNILSGQLLSSKSYKR